MMGLYRTGCFYSEATFGLEDEFDLLPGRGVGRLDYQSARGLSYGGAQKTNRLVVLLHETSHFLHDLSLGASLATDYALDQSSGALTSILQIVSKRRDRLNPPLVERSWGPDSELRTLSESIEQTRLWLSSVWDHPPGLVTFCERRPHFARTLDWVQTLTGDAVCEGLVAAKTVSALTDRIENRDDARYLEQNKDALALFPDTMPALYSTARRIYDAVLGRFIDPAGWRLKEVWPLRYAGSPRRLSDIGFIYLTDIALHIPPLEAIAQRIHEGRNLPEDFWPAFRFCKALDSLRRRGGFPPDQSADSPEVFYRTVFDYIAADPELRWPTFQETIDLWKAHLWKFKKTRGEAADGYRFRLIVERENKPHSVVMADPVIVCWSQHAPVMQLTPAGFRFWRGTRVADRWYAMPLEWPDMAVTETFRSRRRPLWRDMPADVHAEQLDAVLIAEQGNALLLHQESIYRSLCRQLHTALLYGRSFSCPFGHRGCSTRTEPCSRITRFAGLSDEHCCIREYLAQDRIDPECVVWDTVGG